MELQVLSVVLFFAEDGGQLGQMDVESLLGMQGGEGEASASAESARRPSEDGDNKTASSKKSKKTAFTGESDKEYKAKLKRLLAEVSVAIGDAQLIQQDVPSGLQLVESEVKNTRPPGP